VLYFYLPAEQLHLEERKGEGGEGGKRGEKGKGRRETQEARKKKSGPRVKLQRELQVDLERPETSDRERRSRSKDRENERKEKKEKRKEKRKKEKKEKMIRFGTPRGDPFPLFSLSFFFFCSFFFVLFLLSDGGRTVEGAKMVEASAGEGEGGAHLCHSIGGQPQEEIHHHVS